MARQAKTNLRTKTARARLLPRREAYFAQIAPGKTLGYIRREGAPGSWLVREKIDGSYKYATIGTADDLARADGRDLLTYEQASKQASTTAPDTARSGHLTVRDALDSYFVWFQGRSEHAAVTKAWADKRIAPALGGHRVDRLTKTQIEAWLAGLVRDDPEDQDARRRSQDTANRVLTILKAALNKAFQDDENGITSDNAWRRVKPFHNVGRPRTEHLTASQVRVLIAKARTVDAHFADLIEVAYLTGARLGELAAANVGDFNDDNGTLRVDGKTGLRVVSLTHECVFVLRRITAKREDAAPLLPRADGERWRNTQHRPMQRALALAELPLAASFYTLRHSHISNAIYSQMPLSLIAENCGTSLSMLQRNYAHVLAETRRDMIERTAPRLWRVK